MKKTLRVEGMTCAHCSARVEKALNAIDGVTAKVNLRKKEAVCTLAKPVDDEILRKAVADAGYEVLSVQ